MTVRIGNVDFDNVTMEETVARIVEMTRQTDRPRLVCTGNLDHLAVLDRDPDFTAIYRSADLVLADGMPVVWLSHLAGGAPLKERVAGSDLFWELGRASAETGIRLFFLGGAEGAADRAAEAVRRRYPGAVICGTYCPSFEAFSTGEEQERIRQAICKATPDVLMVGLGAPKQEKWIAANKHLVGVPVSIGVGGSFEMACGMIPRAPKWMHGIGLEWVHRMAQEPGRLVKRYLGRDVPFLIRLVGATLAARAASRRVNARNEGA